MLQVLARPQPPEPLQNDGNLFAPAPELNLWLRAAFIDRDSELFNPDHSHLRFANVGVLWTNVGNTRGGGLIVGTAEMPSAQGGKWAKARFEQQMRGWFGSMPHFLITIYAPYAVEADDATFCSLIEHELYHCGQARDAFGAPKFNRRTGLPVFSMRPHDVEEFVGCARRYGVDACAGQTRQLVEAAQQPPTIAAASIARHCGTCGG